MGCESAIYFLSCGEETEGDGRESDGVIKDRDIIRYGFMKRDALPRSSKLAIQVVLLRTANVTRNP